MSNGVLTVQVARLLRHEFDQQGFDLLCGHGQRDIDPPDKLGKLRSWFGCGPLKPETLLADLDIAIVSRRDRKIYALIEIEETTDKPKVILGDILATLLGNGIAFQGGCDIEVGKWTTFILLVYDAHQLHFNRCEFISEQINALKGKLTTPNALIGRIIIDTFSDKKHLECKVRQYVDEAVNLQGIK